MGDSYRGEKGDTRSLDFRSFWIPLIWGMGKGFRVWG